MDRLTYFLITRKLFESAIWRDDPHLLKLFIYLIGMARHQREPKKFPGFEIGRGELVTSLAQIADDCEYKEGKAVRRWGRMKVSRLLHQLNSYGYIELLRYTYGTCVKICNYDKYQSQDTYKKGDSVTMMLRPCYDDVTKVLPYNKGNKGNNVKQKEKISCSNKKTFEPHSVEMVLAEMLLGFINSRNGNFKKPDLQKWAGEIDKMIRIDNRRACGIMNAICWAQADEFWQDNILSTAKLRKQYDQVIMRMKKDFEDPYEKERQKFMAMGDE